MSIDTFFRRGTASPGRGPACFAEAGAYDGRMESLIAVLPYLIGLGLIGVVVTLFGGLSTLGSGQGEEGREKRKRSNRLMMLRVGLQAGTVALFLLYAALTRWVS